MAIWTEAGGIVGIGGGPAIGISNDGAIVLGEIDDPDTANNVAGLWNQIDGWTRHRWPRTSEPCPEDIDGDGNVAVTDLTAVILAWGNCP